MSKPSKWKVSHALVAKGLATDELEATRFILAGLVIVDDQRIDKPGTLIKQNASLRLKSRGEFVSRGGDKLAGAIEDLSLGPDYFRESVVLDVGASTGGFTDCALKKGAKLVIALDVGTHQLHHSLRQNSQVIPLEQTDIRQFDHSLYPPISIILADVSFNSLERLAESILKVGTPPFSILWLIKPQFELPREKVPKGGIVTSSEDTHEAIHQVKTRLEELGGEGLRVVPSRVRGRSGNQEFFVWAQFSKI